MSPPPDLRWRLADGDPQGTLFDEVERHVGRGEFRGMEFLHVRARRIINEVPKASAVPFRYTINAYRGCSHACVYCMSGDTPVLLAEGRLRPIAELRVGDVVVGTEGVGRDRRCVATPVVAHWSTVKPAFRVTLEDGATLVASGDHRFLTERGWKHVTGAGAGSDRCSHLTSDDTLLGLGPIPPGPIASPPYQRGYLCGIARGDASLAHRVVDLEPLARARSYLQAASVPTTELSFAAATGNRQAIGAIHTRARSPAERIESLIEWPSEPCEDWTKGFLAGIYDAEGHLGGVIRISDDDPEIRAHLCRALARLGFRFVCERPRTNGVCAIRLLGGLPEIVRFTLTVDPATTRKRTITGRAMERTGARRVVSVGALGLEMPMYDITTGTGDFIANGVVSHNCFARPTHEYLGMDAGEDFERRIVVKVNAVERLRAELSPGRWAGDHIAMGTNTDPYQRCEGKYRLTRGIVGVLTEAANPFSILTKSTLVLSDLELLAEGARRTDVAVNLSIGTLDEEVWRMTEPGTPHPLKRVEAVARLNEAGVPSGVLVAPVLPGLSDRPEQLEAVVRACVEAGARSISPILLHLRPGVREQYLGWLADARPDLMDEHARLYPRAYAPKATQNELSRLVARMVARHGGRSASPGEARSVSPPRAPRARPARQLNLGI